MRTKYRAALGGTQLDAVDSAIIIRGIDEAAPAITIGVKNKADRYGAIITGEEIRSRDISIRFAINKSDYAQRMTVLQKVAAWAAPGGRLTVGYRSGQRIDVVCSALPTPTKGIGGIDGEYSLTFRAVKSPRWESTSVNSATVSSCTSGTATITVSGDAPTPLYFTATASAACTWVKAVANDQSMKFSGMTVASGKEFEYYYYDYVQKAKNDGTYSMQYLTTDSNDEIILNPGTNTVRVYSAAAVSWTLYARGRWY